MFFQELPPLSSLFNDDQELNSSENFEENMLQLVNFQENTLQRTCSFNFQENTLQRTCSFNVEENTLQRGFFSNIESCYTQYDQSSTNIFSAPDESEKEHDDILLPPSLMIQQYEQQYKNPPLDNNTENNISQYQSTQEETTAKIEENDFQVSLTEAVAVAASAHFKMNSTTTQVVVPQVPAQQEKKCSVCKTTNNTHKDKRWGNKKYNNRKYTLCRKCYVSQFESRGFFIFSLNDKGEPILTRNPKKNKKLNK